MTTLIRSLILAIITAATMCLNVVAADPTPSQLNSDFVKGITFTAPTKHIELTAEDLVTKAYGVLDTDMSQSQAIEFFDVMNLVPSEDNSRLWLDSIDGYVISYYGMTPMVSACARFTEESISDYSFFFLFPYVSNTDKETANSNQCEFCTTLLQELHDMGADMKANASSDLLFDTTGYYGYSNLNISLIDEGLTDNSGQYIVILEVEPNSFSPADNLIANISF